MRRSLTATRVFLRVSGCHRELRDSATSGAGCGGATDDDAPRAGPGANRRPVTRLVEPGQGEGSTGRGGVATAGGHPPAALALLALLALATAPGPGAARQAGHALHQLLHLAELLDQLADIGGLGAA